MTITQLADGIGGSLGDSLVFAKPLAMSGNVWYVDSHSGLDAASPAGRERLRPLATLAQAITNAVAGDIIVCLSGHTETVTVTYTLAKALTIVGEGTANGVPAVSFAIDSAVNALFGLITGCELRNVRILARVQTSSQDKVQVLTAGVRILGCYFEMSDKDQGSNLEIGASNVRVEGCTFISTTTIATRPVQAVRCPSAISEVHFVNCVFDGGTKGFLNGLAFVNTISAITNLRMEGISLLRGADVQLFTDTTGYLNIQSTSGGSRVVW